MRNMLHQRVLDLTGYVHPSDGDEFFGMSWVLMGQDGHGEMGSMPPSGFLPSMDGLGSASRRDSRIMSAGSVSYHPYRSGGGWAVRWDQYSCRTRVQAHPPTSMLLGHSSRTLDITQSTVGTRPRAGVVSDTTTPTLPISVRPPLVRVIRCLDPIVESLAPMTDSQGMGVGAGHGM